MSLNPLADCNLSLLLEGRVVLHSTLRYSLYHSLSQANADLPAISCLMVTKNRFRQAQCAVDCFQKQTYLVKELVIVDDGEDDRLEHYIRQLQDGSIQYVRLKPENKTLGELRNVAVERALGSYVCQWDDDDLVDPTRLELQMAALRVLKADACCLQRWLLWYPYQHRLAVSCSRIWEGSLLCSKAVLPRYPIQHRGEDTPVVAKVLQSCRVALLNLPVLYIYIIHSQNTFDTEHFEHHWQLASERFEGYDYWAITQKLAKRVPLEAYKQALNPLPPPVSPIANNLFPELDSPPTLQQDKD
jgi:glycosyltransferase involved in cell wall biosynthesis